MASHPSSVQTVSTTSDLVIAAPPIVTLPVAGSAKRFPINRVYCVGRNFAAHAIEMGHDPNKEPPFFFQKNASNVVLHTDGFPYPSMSNDVHFEIELVVALKSGGANIAFEDALGCIYGYAVGLDMTRRDLQGEAKDLRRPWEVGKAFDHSAPCGPIVPAERIGHPTQGAIWVDVGGKRRQEGDLNQMIWKVPEIISYLSKLFTLSPGDLIFTGTPAGVGGIKPGDVMVGHVDGVGDIEVAVR
jgi:fumarylpyruvate hydrolase